MERLAAINAFKEITLSHPHLTLTIKRLGLAINQAERGSMVFMFGPTGVGKSTLASHMREKLDKDFRPEDGFNQSTIPAAVIEAPYSDARQFSWKEFYRRALATLNDPLAHKKVDDPRCSAFAWQARSDPRAPGHELRLAFENALHYRKVRVLIIDEAQHIAKGTSVSGLQEQLDYIKSLANLTGTVIVLVGTYELLSFRNLSGQLSRRSIDVHFPRYRLDAPEEYRIFGSVVRSFASKLPIPCDFKMTDVVEDLYVGSLGCVGILNGWLIKTIKQAVEEGDGIIRMRDLTESMYSHDQMSKMIDEVLEGELLLTPPKDSLKTLKARLGIANNAFAKSTAVQEPIKKHMPFRRKPVRDPVGNRHEIK